MGGPDDMLLGGGRSRPTSTLASIPWTTGCRAVIFDVDGTLVDSERHGHRVAFNLAFEEFGLPYRWDEEEYGELLRTTGGRRRIERYLAGQGMRRAERGRAGRRPCTIARPRS